MLFQGEEDAGDNGANYHADYCTYLINDLAGELPCRALSCSLLSRPSERPYASAALIDFLRAGFPGATPATPFITGGLLPYWQHNVIG